MRRLLFALLLVSWLPCQAAGLRFEALDFKQCRNWRFQDVDPSISTVPFTNEFPDIVALEEELDKRVATTSDGTKDWSVIEGTNIRSKAKNTSEREAENVVCVFRHDPQEIECLGATSRPLSGTRFRPLVQQPKSDSRTFVCYSNCARAVTKVIYQQPWEEGRNRRYDHAYSQFIKRCGIR